MTTTLRINGMTCNNCVRHVDQALRAVSGVSAVEVSLAEQRATVTGEADAAQLLAAVEVAGYSASASDLCTDADIDVNVNLNNKRRP